MDQSTVLKFTGDGSRYLTGVPARDLTQADLDECGQTISALTASGLYEATVAPKDKPTSVRSKQHGE